MDINPANNSIRDKIIQFSNILSKVNLNDLSSEVIQIFDELSAFCSSNEMASSSLEQMLQTDIVLKEACDNLRRIYPLYGYQCEMHAARIIIADRNQNIDECFKYRQGYKKFIERDMNILTKLGVRFAKNSTENDDINLLVTKIAFIGSGPIPNSSTIILSDHAPYVDIYNIDMSHEANQIASVISERILPSHLAQRMHFITQDITENPLPIHVRSILNQCQLIYLAANVGLNQLEKLNILKNIVDRSNNELNEKNNQYFIIKTVKGFQQILFPKVTPQKIATLQANTNDVQDDIDKKFLFQIEEIHYTQGDYGFGSIIARNL